MINRKELVRRHNPVLYGINTESPLSIGNGELAFTADITGMQTLYNTYDILPLCTMSQWGWHTAPGGYSLNDIEMTRYLYENRSFLYTAERFEGSEEAYDWLRHNPHRLNLARVGLVLDGADIQYERISGVKQELDLYSGLLNSAFCIDGAPVRVLSVCAQNTDTLGFCVESPSLSSGRLAVRVDFPYGSHMKSASDWTQVNRHLTKIFEERSDSILLGRFFEQDEYYVYVLVGGGRIARSSAHSFMIEGIGEKLSFTLFFAPYPVVNYYACGFSFEQILSDSANGWEVFWKQGGAADFSASRDVRAKELERRTVLSQYLLAVNSAGSCPPQETGLTCNSWYGKFHLEMHILHAGWLPLWNRGNLLERSVEWYHGILDKARENARRNGFTGARWPKMTGPAGIDSPSRIATLLIWQQPHIIYMLEMLRHSIPKENRLGFMRKHFEMIRETADFMQSFAKPGANGRYNLTPPLIPAQEEHRPEISLNPAFELSYWRFGLSVAVEWASTLGKQEKGWAEVSANMASPPISDGLYIAHENCPDTFEKFNRDHPSMLFAYGFIPCESVNTQVMSNTTDAVIKNWEWNTAWGWDFALTAMTLVRLGRASDAVDILLAEKPKNSYTVNGNNFQKGREGLPLYLPGNGSLLLALAMMLAGYGDARGMPGFPKDGMWDIRFENINPLPH